MEVETPIQKKRKKIQPSDHESEFTIGHAAESERYAQVNRWWRIWNEMVLSPLAMLVFFAGYYFVYQHFGPEAGLVPPGYFTNILAGAMILYIAGIMATMATKFNFPKFYHIIFVTNYSPKESETITGLCIYFLYYGFSIWALTALL